MIDIIRKLKLLLNKKQKRGVWKLTLITLIGAFFEVLSVSLMIPLVSSVLNANFIYENQTVYRICLALGIRSHEWFALLCVVAVILVFVIKNLFLIYKTRMHAKFIDQNRYEMQSQMLAAYLNRPYEFFLTSSTGDIMRNIIVYVNQAFQLLNVLITMLCELIVTVALVTTILVINPLMTAIIAVFLAIVVLIIVLVIRPKLKSYGDVHRRESGRANKWLIQVVEGIKTIQVARREQFFKDNYAASAKQVIKAENRLSVLNEVPRMLIEVGCVFAMLGILAFIMLTDSYALRIIPVLSAFVMAAVKLLPAASHIVNANNAISFLGPSLDALLENMTVLEESAEKKSACPAVDAAPLTLNTAIELNDITYRYPNSADTILDHASMRVPAGQSVGIVGISGAGKTTVVDVLLGLLTPESGSILSDGVDVRSSYDRWLSHIGYIPQNIFLMDASIADNVTFGTPYDADRLEKALSEAQLADFVHHLPDGAQTEIGERGIRLSGGQRQRIGIARALYNNPELLVFDEATSSLDNETESAIMESINSLHGKKTMMIIAHRLQTIENCDIVYRVADGKITRER